MENIRLIIWDLDNTLWQGTISEEAVTLPQARIDLLHTLVDRGIMNSICSKNDFDDVKRFLTEKGLWDLFVFPKISWESKGRYIQEIVENSQLRPETILFIDDNPTNLQEAKYCVPNINISLPDIIDGMLENPLFAGKDDRKRTRLQQYKVLEAKATDKTAYTSDEAFLYASDVHVQIFTDCPAQQERLYELLLRTNQLNFTKKRISAEEFGALLQDEQYNTGYVTASDRYGEYGIIGFFAVKAHTAEHFFFSCRTLGLGVEQWVYAELGYPEIDFAGTTVVTLRKDYRPGWIHNGPRDAASGVQTDSEKPENSPQQADDRQKKVQALIIGGCDLEQVSYYIGQTDGIDITSEFNRNYGKFVVHPEHSEVLRGGMEYSEADKAFLLQNVPFYDKDVFGSTLFQKDYDVVVYSPLIDTALGVYVCRQNPALCAVYGNYQRPVSEDSFPQAEQFLENFEFTGVLSNERFLENLQFLRAHLRPQTLLILLTASEQPIEHPEEPGRVAVHREKNEVLRAFCAEQENTQLVDVNQFIHGSSDHTDNIRHYNRNVYFQIAQALIEAIRTHCGDSVSLEMRDVPRRRSMLFTVKTLLRKSGLYDFAYKIYRKGQKKS